MKVLYAIQTTGNGHICRAKEMIPYLERRFQFDVILSGPKNQLDLGYPIKNHFQGLTLYYTDSGAIHWIKTLFKNNFIRFVKDVLSLPIHEYDLVISDFEPVASWASKIRGVLCFGISNQISLWQKKVPKPEKKYTSVVKCLKYFAPSDCEYGIHYQKFDKRIYAPILRSKVRTLVPATGGGIVVYLPAYHRNVIQTFLSDFPFVTWHVFTATVQSTTQQGTLFLHPIDEDNYLKRLAQADGVITHAGFTTTAEALFLKKPLLVIPIRGQIEQQYNAAALKKLGVCVLKQLTASNSEAIADWLQYPNRIQATFENELKELVDRMAIDYIKITFSEDTILNYP